MFVNILTLVTLSKLVSAVPFNHIRDDITLSSLDTMASTSTSDMSETVAEYAAESTTTITEQASSTVSLLSVMETPVDTSACHQANAKFKILDSYATKHFSSHTPTIGSSEMILEKVADLNTGNGDDQHYTEEESVAIDLILNNLQGKSDMLLPRISLLVANGQANVDSLAEPISDLNNAILAASASLQALSLRPMNQTMMRKRLTSRQLQERGLLTPGQLANTLASIVGGITGTLETLSPLLSSIPILGPLLAGLDATLATTLTSLVPVVGGVLDLVGPLLAPVGGLLNGLGLGLVASLLGI